LIRSIQRDEILSVDTPKGQDNKATHIVKEAVPTKQKNKERYREI
jgi:hypothetical protein